MKNYDCWAWGVGLDSLRVGMLKTLKQKMVRGICFYLEEISEDEIKGFKGERDGKKLMFTHTFPVLNVPCLI